MPSQSQKTLNTVESATRFFPNSFRFLSSRRRSKTLIPASHQQNMRQQWRLFLLGSFLRSPVHLPGRSLANPNSVRSLSSFLQNTCSGHRFASPDLGTRLPVVSTASVFRTFSSEPAVEQTETDQALVTVTDVFSKFKDAGDIAREMGSNDVAISHELVLKVLEHLEASPDIARRFFDWVLETEGERLSSKSYNFMLHVLVTNGLRDEFWDLVDAMRKKGYGVSGSVRDKAVEKFEKEGWVPDMEKLRSLFASGSIDNSVEKVSSRISRMIKSEVWGHGVEEKIQALHADFSYDLVKMVLESLTTEPMKALIFFRWVEESGLTNLDQSTYNSMARILGREDCVDRFWKLVDEMRAKGYEMEMETLVKVLGRFCKRRLIEEAVNLYEFAMAGNNKPSIQCCTFLMRKIAVAKEFDLSLFHRVVRASKAGGNMFSDSMLNSVLKSLNSVGRFEHCDKILGAMEEGGLVVGGNILGQIAFKLAKSGKKDEMTIFLELMKASKSNLDHREWVSSAAGYCDAGDFDKASNYLAKMVSEGVSAASYAFELLVKSYCHKNRALEASKIVHAFAREDQLKLSHNTYKLLIKKLLVRGEFKDAVGVLGLMKCHGFPPSVDPFIEYVSKSGNSDDAIVFLKAMASKSFPSTSVVLRVFEALFKAARHDEAQDLLSKCPSFIRNHADVLDLFCSKSSNEAAVAAFAVA